VPKIFNLGDQHPKLKGVHMIYGEGLCSNIFVIGKEKATIIDTGVGNWMNPVWPQLTEIGIKPQNVEKVIITHAHHDHVSGVFIILEKAKPKVYVHQRDTKYIASYLGETLVKVEEGDIIQTELWPLEVIWTPGHTEGGMCLYAKEERILFSGDTVFPEGNFGNFNGESGGYRQLLNSIKKLTQLKVDIMLAGHGAPVYEDAENNIKMALVGIEMYA
jgi:hydroxyacylglutathione hydrolase